MAHMTPKQCRAARGWLDWTQRQLAENASVGLSTVRSFEGEERETREPQHEALQECLEGAGILFLPKGITPRGLRKGTTAP